MTASFDYFYHSHRHFEPFALLRGHPLCHEWYSRWVDCPAFPRHGCRSGFHDCIFFDFFNAFGTQPDEGHSRTAGSPAACPRVNVETASVRSGGQRRPGAKPGTRPQVNADTRSSWEIFAALRPTQGVSGAFPCSGMGLADRLAEILKQMGATGIALLPLLCFVTVEAVQADNNKGSTIVEQRASTDRGR